MSLIFPKDFEIMKCLCWLAGFDVTSLQIKAQAFTSAPQFGTDKQWRWEQSIIDERVMFPGDSNLRRLEFSTARKQDLFLVSLG